MDCPVCRTTQLVMSERQGIEIDYCPNCRGVWLDRGELDKIIDRSAAAPPTQRDRTPPYAGQPHQQPQAYPPSQPHYPNPQQGHYKKKKREGFLGELFDF